MEGDLDVRLQHSLPPITNPHHGCVLTAEILPDSGVRHLPAALIKDASELNGQPITPHRASPRIGNLSHVNGARHVGILVAEQDATLSTFSPASGAAECLKGSRRPVSKPTIRQRLTIGLTTRPRGIASSSTSPPIDPSNRLTSAESSALRVPQGSGECSCERGQKSSWPAEGQGEPGRLLVYSPLKPLYPNTLSFF